MQCTQGSREVWSMAEGSRAMAGSSRSRTACCQAAEPGFAPCTSPGLALESASAHRSRIPALDRHPNAKNAARRSGSKRERLQQSRTNKSEEHMSELQSLMRISYAVFCLKKKNNLIKYNAYHIKII